MTHVPFVALRAQSRAPHAGFLLAKLAHLYVVQVDDRDAARARLGDAA